MSSKKLTKRTVDACMPREARYVVWDSEVRGLGLRVMPSGQRTYVLKYRFKGAQRWFTIGGHGSPWTPEQARKEARERLHDVNKGIDPASQKEADKRALTLAELCDLYLAEGVHHKKPLTIKSDRGRIERHIKPLLGGKRVDAIERADVERLIVAVTAGKTAEPQGGRRRLGARVRGGQGAAGQCATLLGTLLSFATKRHLRADNPAHGVKKPPVRKMERFLSEAEIGRLALALESYERDGGNRYAVAAIKLLLCTGARRSEILSLEWRDVDFERHCLRLRDSKTREKVIYLNTPALALLSELPRIDGNPHVIVGAKEGGFLKGVDKIWRAVRSQAGMSNVRIHDLRHSFASVGVAGGLSLPVLGALLGHRQAMTTARYAHLSADPLRAANEAVGAVIAAAMNTAKASNVEEFPIERRSA
jgi:integrase